MEERDCGLVSVIVPVYKVEQYLHRCLDSILNQSYKNIEIILIDDGTPSPERSGKICDEYAKKDKRIKVIHQKNGGLSAARNTGLDIANGNFIYFVDSDDWIHKDLIKDNATLLADSDADLVCFNYATYEINGEIIPHNEVKSSIIDGLFLRKMLLDGKITVSVCCKLYKREVWKKLRFPIGMNFEDTYVLPDILIRANKIVCNPNVYYYYNRDNESSITRKSDSIDRQISMLKIYFHRLEIIKKYYKEFYLDNLQFVINQCLKLYNFNLYKTIVDQTTASEWKNFIISHYNECKYIRTKDRIYIFGIRHFNIINWLKGFEYYLKYRKRKDF